MVLLTAAAAFPVLAAPRSAAARLEFKRHSPCPSTGRSAGACPDFVIDHVQPLCAGGADAPINMQWQTVQQAKVKDRDERALCRSMRANR
jgi:hypothetical protein